MIENNNLITIRNKKNENFKTISLENVQDKELSWKAKGIHNYLITRPDGWVVNQSDLCGRSLDGQESLRSGINELILAGYLFRIQKRDKNKRISAWGYLATETKQTPEEIEDYLGEDWFLYKKQVVNLEPGNLNIGNLNLDNLNLENPLHIINRIDNNKNNSIKKDNNKNKLITKVISCAEHKKNLFTNHRSESKDLLEYWNSLPNVKHIAIRDTGCFNRAMKSLDLQLNRSYDREELIAIMDLYNEVLSHPSKYLICKTTIGHQVNLDEFFKFNSHTKKFLDTNNIASKIKSWFKEFEQGKEYIEKQYARPIKNNFRKNEEEVIIKENRYPLTVKQLHKWWVEEHLNGNGNSSENQKDFNIAVFRFMQWYRVNGNKVNWRGYSGLYPSQRIKCLIEVLSDYTGDNDIKTHWLHIDSMYENFLPKYLKRQDMILPGKTLSPIAEWKNIDPGNIEDYY